MTLSAKNKKKLINSKQTEKFFFDKYNTLKRRTIINNVERHQTVLPKTEKYQIINLYHNDDEHFGINKTY